MCSPLVAILLSILFSGCTSNVEKSASAEPKITAGNQEAFPYDMPEEKPDRPLSAAVERNYDAYMGVRPETNELYSQFKYTKLKGFDYNDGDGTISRRDPSKLIFENGRYYVWYTHRQTPVPPVGLHRASESNDTIPSADWDLSDIWYATSEDGFTWKEQGVAVPRPPKPNVGWRSVTTTDILVWKGKYYLYYQGFTEASGKSGGDYCPVAVSYADSPDGPWTAHNEVVIPNGASGEWDQHSIHDPYPLVHDGKVYLYYKSDFGRNETAKNVRMHGLAVSDNPLGPFTKHPLNPLVNSGHETTLFPFKEGVAAFAIRDGNESNTIQYAKDWVNFEIASSVELMPDAAGPFVPDAFSDTKDGRGITWGLSHFARPHGDWKRNHVILVRFDCDLSQDIDDEQMKGHHNAQKIEFLYEQGLVEKQLQRIAKANKALKGQSQ
ncbi:MAG: family 43 glycosylhydrolase [Cyclobacteriaceae bacterium]